MQGTPRELSMPRTTGVGLFVLVALVACTHFNQGPAPAAEATAEAAVNPPATPTAATPTAGAPTAASSAAASPPAPSPAAATAKPTRPKIAGTANSKSPRGGGSAKPLPAEQRSTPAAAAVQQAAGPPASPALDLAGLEQRLRDTHAIGVFTKLSLKNQVDDLLGAFRTFHGGQTQPPLSELRQRYDLLLLKVLTLLQDDDAPLASAISASREAIWALLADRDKFQKIQLS
jgi:hypothetical protein